MENSKDISTRELERSGDLEDVFEETSKEGKKEVEQEQEQEQQEQEQEQQEQEHEQEQEQEEQEEPTAGEEEETCISIQYTSEPCKLTKEEPAIATADPSLEKVISKLQDGIAGSGRSVQQNFSQVKKYNQIFENVGTTNLSCGGSQIIHPPKKELSAADRLNRRTVSRLETWTKGMVKTSAFKKVMAKLDNGASWVTIKGCPGEGKTTTAYMVLNELHKAGRKIFDVTTPEDFTLVVESGEDNPVVMLDDVFGNLEFDKSEWSRWKIILCKSLEEKDRQSQRDDKKEGETVKTKQEITIILIGREYVLKVCTSDLGKLANFFTHEKHVVDMSSAGQRQVEEKVEIWNAISAAGGITLDDDTIQEICRIDLPHGFPHVCKLFVTLRKENVQLSPEKFFAKPLQFLNETIKSFISNEQKCALFKVMLQNGVAITSHKLEKCNPQLGRVATELVGTYLKKEDDSYRFDHPSVYDSVAFNLCEFETSFVIQNCDMSFIHERIRLEGKEERKTESNLVYTIPRVWIPDLAERFAKEISHGYFAQSLSHQAFTDEEFVKETMSLITISLEKLIKMQEPTTRHRFLVFVSSNGSSEVLKYIDTHLKVKLIEEDFSNIVYGMCHFSANGVLNYLKEKGTFDVNADSGAFLVPAVVAAKGRNEAFVSNLLTLTPDVHCRDRDGLTLLHVLAENGLTSAVGSVIEMGADVNSRDIRGETPLHYSCKSGNENIVKLLIEKGADINKKDQSGSTPLIIAIRFNHANIVQNLIEKGADLDIKITKDNTPLFYACQGKHLQIVKALIKGGAKMHDAEFLVACEKGCVKLVECFFENEYQISKQEIVDTSFMIAAVESGNVNMVERLIQYGVSTNQRGMSNELPLHKACANNVLDIVQILLDNDADVNARDFSDNRPLHLATSEQCVQILFKFNPEILTKNKQGDTLLHTSASNGLTECVRTLIAKKVDVEAKNVCQETPLLCASRKGASDCVNLLIKAGANVNVISNDGNTPLHLAAASSYDECVLHLIRAGVSVNAKNTNGHSVLQHSILSKSPVSVVDVLIKANADVNVRLNTDDTLLHWAVSHQAFHVIPLLLEAGANVHFTNTQGQTPLHVILNSWYCCEDEHRVVAVKEMIRHGANVNSRDPYGNVPLHYFYPNTDQKKEIASYLIQSGADINIRNMNCENLPWIRRFNIALS